ncbi:MAG: TonB-dependent receptor [Chitinophagaceae bacterium]|nr:TonB-dependent receptor [Chitinophagaceae bacterium]
MRTIPFLFMLLLLFHSTIGQQSQSDPGIIAGNILDSKQAAVAGATIELLSVRDTLYRRGTISDKNGEFVFQNLSFGLYRIRITSMGFNLMIIDSISLRAERFDFNLNDVILKMASDELSQVVVYAEKPLIQSKEGNITFNASESPLSAGSNASDLLKNVPLVAADPEGKLTVRGKEPKILIDDKPVELNAQQLQDFLESMPGSMIERIEVMTNPPPQYANEPGGVINIVTKRGKVGRTGRLSIYGGTRGETGINGNFSYRKKGLSINFNAGIGYNEFQGNGYSRRENIYVDSSNFFNTDNNYKNRSYRPNARVSIDYEINPRHSFNAVIQINDNNFKNNSNTQFANFDRFKAVGRLSRRTIKSEGNNLNPAMNFTYTYKGKKPGETLRLFGNANVSFNESDRYFFQEFLYSDFTPNGIDSTQQQFNNSRNNGYNLRAAYDKMLDNKHTFLAAGAYYNRSTSNVDLLSEYWKKPENIFLKSDLLSNDFRFRQAIANLRFSVKQIIARGTSITIGLNAEQTSVQFDLFQFKQKASNTYWTLLPFFNFNKQWEEVINLTVAYRRTIRRPGIGQLNPTIDYTDPYNLRFGNTELKPSTSHNFDLLLGRNHDKYYLNLGLGFNLVQDVFTQIRSLQPDGKTFITWENIDDRQEFEISSWNGYNFSKKLRLNVSASYSYNKYSAFDKLTYRYRDGGSFNSNINANYAPKDVWNFNSGLTFNRFANPQGFVRWNTSMNLGLQRKFFQKRFIITVNVIDPIQQQVNKTFTYGTNFQHESYNFTQTRNYRLTLTYNFIPVAKKGSTVEADKQKLKKLMPTK